MKLGDMKSHEQAVVEELARDPEFRREWERTALAREVAAAVIGYRAAHKLPAGTGRTTRLAAIGSQPTRSC